VISPRHRSLVVVLFALSVSAIVRAAPLTLSGRWAASGMIVSWNIGDWGESCGPKPDARGAPAGPVTITQRGGELTFSGAGGTYSTTQCWEQYPGLARTSHRGGTRGWRTTCKTSAGDPRQAAIVTTITASDAYIRFDETGQYQFVVQGQNCTASVRRSRSFRLVQREGEALPAPSASAPPSAPQVAAPAQRTRCQKVGPPARLEVRPARKLMRPGETFKFRARVQDAAGCVADVVPAFRLETKGAPVDVLRAGEVRVHESAPEGDVALLASVPGRSLRVVVEVVSTARYASLLESERFTKEGESKDAAVAASASSSVGTRAAVAEERARGKRTTFVAIVGAAALILGIVGLILVVRSRKQAAARGAAAVALPGRATPEAPRIAGTICPTCREEYPASTQFCPLDGNRLAAVIADRDSRGPAGGVCAVCGQGFDPGVTSCPKHDEELVPIAVYRASLAQAAELAKVCPICGTQYPGDGRFCGKDGAALVPMN